MRLVKNSYEKNGSVYVVQSELCSSFLSASRQARWNALRAFGCNVVTFNGPETFLQETKMSPAVFVFDIQERDWGGVELLANVQKDQSDVPVIFLGTDANSKEIVKAMKQQAVDFLINPFTFEDLCVVIEAAMAVCVQNASRDHSEIVTRNLLKSLTARELEICFLMIRGYGNIEISEFNGSAPGTVKIHRGRVLSKMGVANLSALVKLLCSNSELRWQTLG